MSTQDASTAMRRAVDPLDRPDLPHAEADAPDVSDAPPQKIATRGQSRLLDALGWAHKVMAARDPDVHDALRCWCILRNGAHGEAVFGYAGVKTPQDTDDRDLKMAQAKVALFLDQIDEEVGVLLQNRPVFAFSPGARDRIAIFGGWRFDRGVWQPFLLGPGGLEHVASQAPLFTPDNAPFHLADICGYPSDRVLPHLVGLIRAADEAAGKTVSGVTSERPVRLLVTPHEGGWFTGALEAAAPARTRPSPVRGASAKSPKAQPLVLSPSHKVASSGPETEGPETGRPSDWDPDADQFRFHGYGAERL